MKMSPKLHRCFVDLTSILHRFARFTGGEISELKLEYGAKTTTFTSEVNVRMNLIRPFSIICALTACSMSTAIISPGVMADQTLEQAKELSKKTGRPILAVAGSKT